MSGDRGGPELKGIDVKAVMERIKMLRGVVPQRIQVDYDGFTDHLDVFTVGSDGLVYSTWWDGATGWAGWFQLGVT